MFAPARFRPMAASDGSGEEARKSFFEHGPPGTHRAAAHRPGLVRLNASWMSQQRLCRGGLLRPTPISQGARRCASLCDPPAASVRVKRDRILQRCSRAAAPLEQGVEAAGTTTSGRCMGPIGTGARVPRREKTNATANSSRQASAPGAVREGTGFWITVSSSRRSMLGTKSKTIAHAQAAAVSARIERRSAAR